MEDKENDIRLERDLHEGRTARDMKEARGEVRGKNWEGDFGSFQDEQTCVLTSHNCSFIDLSKMK